MNGNLKHGTTSPWAMVVILFGALAAFVMHFRPSHSGRSRSFPEAMNNIRQVKFAMDSFAADHNGHYPNQATGDALGLFSFGYDSSNDYFRQFFLSDDTQTEKIFWVRKSPIASEAPDNILGQNGLIEASEVLKPGDVHWAYMTGQRNDSNVARPLLLDPFQPGTSEFDPKLWNRKVIILTIDGSAKAVRLDPVSKRVLDGSGIDIFSPDADAWHGSGLDPRELLKQPEARPAP